MRKRISVVMPVYNTPSSYLKEAMDSILAQTFSDFEFIIVNDGSTESSVEDTILSYSDERIVYLKKENSGIADTLNVGIKKATGEFIARMDADDISLPQRFERQVEFLDGHPEIAICGSWFEWFPVGWTTKKPARFGLLELGLDGCQLGHVTVMFRRETFAHHELWYNPEFNHAEDYELWSRAALVVKMANLQEVLVRVRLNPNGVTISNARDQRDKARRVKDRILEFVGFDAAAYRHVNRLSGVCRETKITLWGIPVGRICRVDNASVLYMFHCLPLIKWKTVEERN